LSPRHHLERWAGSNDEQVTGVFEHQPKPPIESETIEIADAPLGGPNAADQEIVRIVREDAAPEEIHVVTSDRGLADQVGSANALEPAAKFRWQVEVA
jgi:uncharacterized protein YaiI (UPF0178 family)